MFYFIFCCSFSNSQIFFNGSHSNWNCSFFQIDLCNIGRLRWWITTVFLNQAWHRVSLPGVINILGIKLRIGSKILCGLCRSVAFSCSWGNRQLWLKGVINGNTRADQSEMWYNVICMCPCVVVFLWVINILYIVRYKGYKHSLELGCPFSITVSFSPFIFLRLISNIA